jgi:ATP-dependent RNA helicase RhlE
MAGAQTGTGKTAGFVLPMLQRLSTTPLARRAPAPVRALILTPTRELAAQVEASVRRTASTCSSRRRVFGGVGFGPQIAQLRRGVDILVATPGRPSRPSRPAQRRFLGGRHLRARRGRIACSTWASLPTSSACSRSCPRKRQNLCSPRRSPDDIREGWPGRLLDQPRTIQATPRNSTVESIAQRVHPVNRHEKSQLLAYLIGQNRWQQVLVFTRTKHGAGQAGALVEADWHPPLVALHGNKTQNARTKALARFQAQHRRSAGRDRHRGARHRHRAAAARGELRPAERARGLRASHRRTGRAGAAGEAISLVCVDEHAFLRDIERLLKRPIERRPSPGFEPDPSAVAQPVFASRGRAGQEAGSRDQRNGAHARNDRNSGKSAHGGKVAQGVKVAQGGHGRNDRNGAPRPQSRSDRPAPRGHASASRERGHGNHR